MKIEKIRFGRLRTFGNYENVTLEMEATVEKGMNADDTLANLAMIVDTKLQSIIDEPRYKWVSEELKALQDEVEQRRKTVQELDEKIEARRALLYGIDQFLEKEKSGDKEGKKSE